MAHNFTVCDAPQRSPTWFAARAGRLTGSVAADMMTTLKGGKEAAVRRDLRTKLALERILGQPLEDGTGYVNADMQRGIELEPQARAAYEALTGEIVQETGFLAHTELPIGASLDGHLGDFETIWECKCPRSATHWKYLQAGTVPAEHRWQLVHNLYVTGANAAVFCSYNRQFPEPLRLFTVRLEADDDEIVRYADDLSRFLAEIANEVLAIQDRLTKKGLVTVCDRCGKRPRVGIIPLCHECAQYDQDYATGEHAQDIGDTSHPGHPSNYGSS